MVRGWCPPSGGRSRHCAPSPSPKVCSPLTQRPQAPQVPRGTVIPGHPLPQCSPHGAPAWPPSRPRARHPPNPTCPSPTPPWPGAAESPERRPAPCALTPPSSAPPCPLSPHPRAQGARPPPAPCSCHPQPHVPTPRGHGELWAFPQPGRPPSPPTWHGAVVGDEGCQVDRALVDVQVPHAAHEVAAADGEALGQGGHPAQQQRPRQIQRPAAPASPAGARGAPPTCTVTPPVPGLTFWSRTGCPAPRTSNCPAWGRT